MSNCQIKNKIISFWKKTRIIAVIFLGMAIFNLSACSAFAVELNHDYPRLANYFLKWQVSHDDAVELAKWDVVILGAWVQHFNPEAIKTIRQINPDVKILAYLATESLYATDIDLHPSNPLRKLYNEVESQDWWLRDVSGSHVNFWPGTQMINAVKTGWLDYLADFARDEVMATGLWDGVYYDNAFQYVCWINNGNIDLNRDGRAESSAELNSSWQNAMKRFFQKTRTNLGDEAFIIVNSSNLYLDKLNGRLLEGFPYGYENDVLAEMNLYYQGQKFENPYPRISINNTNTENTGKADDYRRMRFGLTTTLLMDGYFTFDYGDKDHAQTWWYDEYEIFLDRPLGDFYNINSGSQVIEPGIFRRDFSKGLVLTNLSQENSRVRLEGEYEKISGTQDPEINDGMRVTSVRLPAHDGLVLIKPVEKLVETVFINGSHLRVFDSFGNQARSSFFAYEDDFWGGAYVAEVDLNNDGQNEFIVSQQNEIQIFKNDKLIKKFYPYTENYKGKVSFDICDLNGDGRLSIVSGVASHGGPHVRIFDASGELSHLGFFAYAENFRGGVNISCGDIDGDGRDEIITGANHGGGPHVRIFNGRGELKYPGFFAFDKNFRGGVNLASGDMNGDGRDEIVATMGKGGDARVRIFDVFGDLKSEFVAIKETNKLGLDVLVSDIDNSGKSNILVRVPSW